MISLQFLSFHICLQILYSSIPLIGLYLILAVVSGILEKWFAGVNSGQHPEVRPLAGTGRGHFFKAMVISIFLLAGVLTIYQTRPAVLDRIILACTRQVQCTSKNAAG